MQKEQASCYVIPSKLLLRREGSGRSAQSVAVLATHKARLDRILIKNYISRHTSLNS